MRWKSKQPTQNSAPGASVNNLKAEIVVPMRGQIKNFERVCSTTFLSVQDVKDLAKLVWFMAITG